MSRYTVVYGALAVFALVRGLILVAASGDNFGYLYLIAAVGLVISMVARHERRRPH